MDREWVVAAVLLCGTVALVSWLVHATWLAVSSIADQNYLDLHLGPLVARAVLDAIESGAMTGALALLVALAVAAGSRVLRPGIRADPGLVRWLQFAGAASALVLAGVYGTALLTLPAPTGGPNVLLITLDTVRRDHLSLHGHTRPTSPELDRFAEQALVFEHAYAVGAWTTPNHASMFTGLHPIDHGASEEYKFLVPTAVTLAEILAARGYETAAFVNNANLGMRRGVTQGFQILVDNWERRDQGTRLQVGAPQGDDGAHRTVADVLEWVEEGRDAARPFFLFVNFMEAHWPYDPPKAERELFVGEVTPPDYVVTPNTWSFVSGDYSLTSDEIQLAEALYDAEIRYMDSQLGRLLRGLEALGALEDTLVVITSDHGEMFGERGLIGHHLGLYDDVLAIPLVVRAPGPVAGGPAVGRVAEPVSLVDVFTTTLDVVGAEPPGGMARRGRSLLAPLEPSPMIAEYYRPVHHLKKLRKLHPHFDASTFDRRLRVIRDGGDKLIWGSDGSRELYRIADDPHEATDRAGVDPARVERLAEHLKGWVEERGGDGMPASASRPAAPAVDRRTREALEALGYAE